jgi:hypothetical protein
VLLGDGEETVDNNDCAADAAPPDDELLELVASVVDATEPARLVSS